MSQIEEEIPSLSPVPTTADPANFDTNADSLLGTRLPAFRDAVNVWAGEANTLAEEVNADAESASNSSDSALAAKISAEAAQAAAEAASNATEWVSGQAYVAGDVVWSPSTYLSYRAVGATSGTTDPSQSASWVLLAVDVPRFTNPLAQAVSVQMTASTTVGGIQQLDNDNLDMGTNDFTLEFDELLPTTRPAAAIVLDRKHNGTNGYILSLLTTGIVRLQINGFNFDSTVALASATNVNPKLQVPVIRETATVAGSVTFYSNGVILGVAVAITAHEAIAELVTNGTFDTDITGWVTQDISNAVIDWFNNALRISTNSGGANSNAGQAVSTTQGKSYLASISYSAATSSVINWRVFKDEDNGPTLANSGDTTVTGAGEFTLPFVAESDTVYIRMQVKSANDTVEFDNASVKQVVSASNTAPRIINGTTTTRTAGSLQASRLFNRALTSAEVLDLSINGVALADRGASQTPFVYSNFSGGTTGFTAGSNVTVTERTDDPVTGGKYITFSSTSTTSSFQNSINTSSAQVTSADVGKTKRVVIRARRRGAGTGDLIVGQSVAGYWENGFTIPGASLTSSFQVFIGTFVVQTITGTAGRIGFRQGINSGSPGEEFDVDEISLVSVGVTSELLASNAQSDTGQIFDTSGNKNHALLPASGATVVGRPVSQTREVRWTNTWAGTNDLQYIGGVNQAILPANAYIESIIGTVSGATPHDIIVGDGSDADRYVTITTGLAAGTTNFALAARTTDGTNLKLTVDPDTDCSMSIAWVISYRTLE